MVTNAMPNQDCQSPTGCHHGRSIGLGTTWSGAKRGFLLRYFTPTKTLVARGGDAGTSVTWTTWALRA